MVKGRTIAESEALFERFQGLVTCQRAGVNDHPLRRAGAASPAPADTAGTRAADPGELGSLAVFSGVSRFPVLVKCASLSWHTLRLALRDAAASASGE